MGQTPAIERIRENCFKEWVRPYYLKWMYFRLHPEARPEHWGKSWAYPNVGLGEIERLAEPGSGLDFLFLPMNDWHTRLQRPHHLAKELARAGHRCVYVNPNFGREFPEPGAFAEPRLARLEERIWELHVPLKREPVFHHRMLRGGESASVARAVARTAVGLGVRRLVQVVSFPVWRDVARGVAQVVDSVTVYDCHDLLRGFRRIAEELVSAEPECLRMADVVLFSARTLEETMLREVPDIRGKSVVLRNGVAVEHFAGARRARGPKGRTGPPVIGYVGALDEWLDVEALRVAAARHPEWRFLLLGRVEDPRVRVLEELGNVELPGEVGYAELPAWLRKFDVGVIPFLRTPLTVATNPIKLYEYFSGGMPVVSAALPEVEQFGQLVRVAQSGEEWVTQLEAALEDDETGLAERRLAIAREQSWRARVEQLLALVQPLQSRPVVVKGA